MRCTFALCNHARLGRSTSVRFLVLAGLLMGVLAVGPVAGAATLVEDGRSRATIVLEQNPKDPTRLAARDLADYLQQISGAEVQVVDSGTAVSTPVTIWVGLDHPGLAERFAGLDLNLTEYEQIVIAVRGDDVLIAGNDGKTHGLVWQQGTAAALYTFIEERLGVRWLWPGELGTDVPQQATIALDNFVYEYTPPLKQRHLRTQHYSKNIRGYRGEHQNVEQRVESLSEEMWLWRRRHRSEQRFVTANHAFTDWWQKYHRDHPDYFALQPDGTRTLATPADRVKLCISNPAVTRQWVENAVQQLDNKPYMFLVSASPNDNEYEAYCTCSNCASWDARGGKMITLRWKNKKAQHVALTDRYARWWNILARELKQRYPDREVYVGTWGYGAYRTPPVEVKLEDNIIVGLISSLPAYSRARRAEERQIWLGWASQIENMVWRPNLFYYDRGMPHVYVTRAAEDFAWLTDHKMIGFDLDTIYAHWALQGLQYYHLAKLSWNPHLDVDEFMTDYTTRAFGPQAAPYMRTYFEGLERIFYEKVERDATASGGMDRIAHLPSIYTPARLRQLQGQLDQARQAVSEGDRAEVYRQRIDFFQTGLNFTMLQIDAIDAMNRLRNARGNRQGLYQRALDAASKRDAFLDAQIDSHALNTVEGFNNWTNSDALRQYFGPPDESMLRN